jgi:hypothetical protein
MTDTIECHSACTTLIKAATSNHQQLELCTLADKQARAAVHRAVAAVCPALHTRSDIDPATGDHTVIVVQWAKKATATAARYVRVYEILVFERSDFSMQQV